MENYIIITASGVLSALILGVLFFIYLFWKKHREAQNQNAQRWWRHLSRDKKDTLFFKNVEGITLKRTKTIRRLYKEHLRKYK